MDKDMYGVNISWDSMALLGSSELSYTLCGAGGSGGIINNNNNMKEENKKLYRLTFVKTDITKEVVEVMAESKDEAKELVSKGNGYRKSGVSISQETKLAKIKRIGGGLIKSLLS